MIHFVAWSPLYLIAIIMVASMVVIMVPIAIPFAAIGFALELSRRLVYGWRWRGRIFLVATRKRGWHEFILNNVLPTLPPNAQLIWWHVLSRDGLPTRHPVLDHLPKRAVNLQKPYALRIGVLRWQVIPLHEKLKPLQEVKTRDEGTSAAVRTVMEEALGGVWPRHGAPPRA